MYATRKGEVTFANFEEELNTVGCKVEGDECIGLQRAGKSIITGDKSGKLSLISFDYSNEDEEYSFQRTTPIFENCAPSKLTRIRVDEKSGFKLACLREDKPPVVK